MRVSVFLGSIALLAVFDAAFPGFSLAALQGPAAECREYFPCKPMRGDFGIHDELSEIKITDGICRDIYQAAGDLYLDDRIWIHNEVSFGQGMHAGHTLGWHEDIFLSCAYWDTACEPLQVMPPEPTDALAQTIIHEVAHHLGMDEDSAEALEDECWVHGGT